MRKKEGGSVDIEDLRGGRGSLGDEIPLSPGLRLKRRAEVAEMFGITDRQMLLLCKQLGIPMLKKRGERYVNLVVLLPALHACLRPGGPGIDLRTIGNDGPRLGADRESRGTAIDSKFREKLKTDLPKLLKELDRLYRTARNSHALGGGDIPGGRPKRQKYLMDLGDAPEESAPEQADVPQSEDEADPTVGVVLQDVIGGVHWRLGAERVRASALKLRRLLKTGFIGEGCLYQILDKKTGDKDVGAVHVREVGDDVSGGSAESDGGPAREEQSASEAAEADAVGSESGASDDSGGGGGGDPRDDDKPDIDEFADAEVFSGHRPPDDDSEYGLSGGVDTGR